ncbi:PD-(D/E)XK nuclease family protein [Halorubellus sp. PRR65]|uniref:PD-(D/E)XK nuclease family protein n=1 Tax=Halorubellus sp. PRR65 TaxID=3098148 RepID=UPI002B25DA45|nr:PD-(D/E)XK nuclease family protein [Halorubellus sp. PRR65]
MPDDSLEATLQTIEAQLDDVEQRPATTLDVLGEATRERYWEALLVYFLDPANPHGFSTDVLRAFLKALAAHDETTVRAALHDLDGVEVHSQVVTTDGLVDVVLWNDDAWFVCLELKVEAGETDAQTTRYANAPALGDLVVDEHGGVGEYVYLAPRRAGSSSAASFVDVSWEHLVPYFEDVLRASSGQYPAKSQAQFADFVDTIRRTLNMDDDTIISEETRLYTEYAETIDRLVGAFEDDKETVFTRLEEAFLADLGGDRENWRVNTRPNTYINFAKPTCQNLPGGTTIEYEPHVTLNRDTQQIRLRLDIEHGDKDTIRDALRDRLSEDEREALDAADWQVEDTTYAYLAKTCPLDLAAPEASIQTASDDLHALHDIVGPHIDAIVTQRRDA